MNKINQCFLSFNVELPWPDMVLEHRSQNSCNSYCPESCSYLSAASVMRFILCTEPSALLNVQYTWALMRFFYLLPLCAWIHLSAHEYPCLILSPFHLLHWTYAAENRFNILVHLKFAFPVAWDRTAHSRTWATYSSLSFLKEAMLTMLAPQKPSHWTSDPVFERGQIEGKSSEIRWKRRWKEKEWGC